jgi:hypothetical protein
LRPSLAVKSEQEDQSNEKEIMLIVTKLPESPITLTVLIFLLMSFPDKVFARVKTTWVSFPQRVGKGTGVAFILQPLPMTGM